MKIPYIGIKNNIFIRLVITFLLVITPVYLIGMNIYNWGKNSIREQISDSMIAQDDFYLNGLDSEIQRIKLLQSDCVNDDSLDSLAFSPEVLDNYGRTHAYVLLQQHIYAIKNSSRYIVDVRVYLPLLQKTVSASSGVDTLDSDALDFGTDKKISEESQLSYAGNALFLNLFCPYTGADPRTGKQVSKYIIQIALSNKAFFNDLSQFDNNGKSMSFLINQSNGLLFQDGMSLNNEDKVYSSFYSHLQKSHSGAYYDQISGKPYLAVYTTSEYLGLTFAKFLPEDEVFKRLQGYQMWFWGLSFVSIVIIVLYSLSTYRIIHIPLAKLVKAFRAVESGNLKVNIDHRHDDEFRYLYHRFNAMVDNLNVLIDQAYKQKILAQHAELKQLQSQINPHFLYNTFFILLGMAKAEDNENVIRFLQQLGDYFQYITRSTADEIPLGNEIGHARTYTEIQMLRFSNRIRTEFAELPDGFKNLSVPRLIVQPIIENAFKYGLEDKISGGLIQISFQSDKGGFSIVIEDNGDGLSDAMLESMRATLSEDFGGETTAIVNISRRLKLKYGTESGLTLSRSELGGLKAEIRIVLSEVAACTEF